MADWRSTYTRLRTRQRSLTQRCRVGAPKPGPCPEGEKTSETASAPRAASVKEHIRELKALPEHELRALAQQHGVKAASHAARAMLLASKLRKATPPKPAAPRPATTPAPVKTPDPVAAVHEAIRLHGGEHNHAPMHKVRAYLAEQGIREPAAQDAAINAARRAGAVGASAIEGRQGTSAEERAAALAEGETLLGHLSLREKSVTERCREGEVKPGPCPESKDNAASQPTTPASTPTLPRQQSGVLNRLGKTGRAVRKMKVAEHRLLGMVKAHVPGKLQAAASLAIKGVFSSWIPAQATAYAIAKEVGGERHAKRVARMLIGADLIGAKVGPIIAGALGGPAAATTAYMTPLASSFYVLYSLARHPKAVLAAAKKAIQKVRQAAGSLGAKVGLSHKAGWQEGAGETRWSREAIAELLRGMESAADPDWYEALVWAALLETGGDLEEAVRLVQDAEQGDMPSTSQKSMTVSDLHVLLTLRAGFTGEKKDKRGYRMCYEEGRRTKCAPKSAADRANDRRNQRPEEKEKQGAAGAEKPQEKKPAAEKKPRTPRQPKVPAPSVDDMADALAKSREMGLTPDMLKDAAELLGRMTVKDIQAVKAKLGLKASGVKAQLVQKIMAAVGATKTNAAAGPATPREKKPTAAKETPASVLQAVQSLSEKQRGGPVMARDITQAMPGTSPEQVGKELEKLADEGKVILHRHDQPSFLTDAEKTQLPRLSNGTYITAVDFRPEEGASEGSTEPMASEPQTPAPAEEAQPAPEETGTDATQKENDFFTAYALSDRGQMEDIARSLGVDVQPGMSNEELVDAVVEKAKAAKGQTTKDPAVARREAEEATTKAAEEASTQGYSEWFDRLPEKQREALSSYLGNDHKNINEHLRTGKKISPELAAHIPVLDRAIASSPGLSKPATLYRGLRPGVVPADVKPGQTISDKGFNSTSFSPWYGKPGNFGRAGQGDALVINAPQGTKGARMYGAHGGGEAEFLLPRGASYRVAKIEDTPEGRIIHVDLAKTEGET